MQPRATVDFETRSAADLNATGTWRYSVDPTTEVFCLAYRLPHWRAGDVGLWHPAFRPSGLREARDSRLGELFAWIAAGRILEAHSAWFEHSIWQNIMEPRFSWPHVDSAQWRCSAAKAASCALPRNLDDALSALRLDIRKDEEGRKLMMKMTRPRKPLAKERHAWAVQHAHCPECFGKGKVKFGRARQTVCVRCAGKGYVRTPPPMPRLWHETPEQLQRLFDYCKQDVLAEEALSNAIPDLNDTETAYYWMDQIINERGFGLDREAVDAALDLVAQESVFLNRELNEITQGEVSKATQRERMKAWLAKQGVLLDNTQAATLDAVLAGEMPWGDLGTCDEELPANARRALELMRALGRSSTAKYEAMRAQADPADTRVRGGLLYHGATTGRWSGAGVQPHNFPKGTLKEKDMDRLWSVLKTRDRDVIRQTYGDVLQALSHGLRGAIVAAPGSELFVADYAAIEARVVLWLARDTRALGIFERGEDIYLDMAQTIYGRVCTKDDKAERGIGKIAILGLGYQMGWAKFQATALKGGVTLEDDFAQRVVDAYRDKFWKVKQMWWDMEAAAIEAAENPGTEVACGYVTYIADDTFLWCVLPSGRRLAYPFPEVREKETPWGEIRPQLTFMGVNAYNHQWQRQPTYGGMLVENVTQAVARDIMAEAMWRLEHSGLYVPILSVHDEIVAEAPIGLGDVLAFEHIMTQVPAWGIGCPIAAEGWKGPRYHK